MKWDPARPPDGLEGPSEHITPCTAQAYARHEQWRTRRGGPADMGSHKHNTTIPRRPQVVLYTDSTGAAKGVRGELCTAVREEESMAVWATRKSQNSGLHDQCMMPLRAMHGMHVNCCLQTETQTISHAEGSYSVQSYHGLH